MNGATLPHLGAIKLLSVLGIFLKFKMYNIKHVGNLRQKYKVICGKILNVT